MGLGDLGDGAYQFLDFLERAHQSIWQILPLGPPARGGSPYSCYSAFAGNPLLISVKKMVESGLLDSLAPVDGQPSSDNAPPNTADFEAAKRQKHPHFVRAFEQFKATQGETEPSYVEFLQVNQGWLDDFALYVSVADHLGEVDWTQWETGLVRRDSAAMDRWRETLATEVAFAKFLQFVFRCQYDELKAAANLKGIQLFGDMPIFVAHESADVWANQQIFHLDAAGKPTVVAGVPPDYFSKTGQLWGNPLYDWDYLRDTGYAWWTERFRAAFRDFDLLRLDHFRGFESYWEVPATAATAIEGHWEPGPGDDLFLAVAKELGQLPIIAEDLGLITDEVHHLRDRLGFPGMRVMQFGFDSEDDPYHRPDHFPTHSVAYTGTHDNDTIIGWYDARPSDSNWLLHRYLADGGDLLHRQLVRLVLDSSADLAIVPLQDLLGLGTDARMNVPGLADGNWTWRCTESDLSDELASDLGHWTSAAGRMPAKA